jgi:hypothetical protein
LRQVKAHLKSLFAHPIIAAAPAAFPHSWLGAERRKTGCECAKATGNQAAASAGHAQAQHGGLFCLFGSNSSGPDDNEQVTPSMILGEQNCRWCLGCPLNGKKPAGLQAGLHVLWKT